MTASIITDTTSASDIAQAAGVGCASVKRHIAIEQKAPNLLPVVERGDIGLQTAERPEARCRSLVRAAQELRDQRRALSTMEPTDEILAAFAEVRFILGKFSNALQYMGVADGQ